MLMYFSIVINYNINIYPLIHFSDHNRRVQCIICFKGFADKYNLNRHTREVHHAKSQPKGSCDLCGKSYLVRRMKDHMRSTHIKMRCERCHKMVANYFVYKNHLPRCKNIEYRSIKAKK